MTADSRHIYIARINRVIDHIDRHLAQPLDLVALAGVAHFSPWHFHRVFLAMTGETLAERVRRRRLEVAAARLLATPPATALSIALDVGFASAEVFTRAFRARFGVTPSAWRRGAWRDWAAVHRAQLRKIHQDQRKQHQDVVRSFLEHAALWPAGRIDDPGGLDMDVQIRQLPPTRVAYMRHTGAYGTAGIPRLWQRFAAWCAGQGLMQPRRTMYGISQDNPEITPPDRCRYDVCVEVSDDFLPDGEVGVQTLRGGRYACARFVGTSEDIHAAWADLCGRWLPDSGYQADDAPGIEIYESDFVMDEHTGAFSCWLCIPVRVL